MRTRASIAVAAAVTTTATIVALLVPGAPVRAGSVVTVRGTDFPGLTAQLSFVGCSSLYDRSTEMVQPYVSNDAAATGARSLKFDLGGGNAVGSLHYVASMAGTTTAELSVKADGGTAGVAYAGLQEPADAGTNRIWVGRADVAAAPGAWQSVSAIGRTYTWTKYDISSGSTVDTAPAGTVAALVAQHGDGPGFYTIGFGCDGQEFHVDAMRIGSDGDVTTFDLEGLETSLTIAASRQKVKAGDPVTLTGALRTHEGTRLPESRILLEQRTQGGGWEPVESVEAGTADPAVEVKPKQTTTYRFRFVDRPLAEGSVSDTVTVEVEDGAPAPKPTDGPSGSADDSTGGRTDGPSEASSPAASEQAPVQQQDNSQQSSQEQKSSQQESQQPAPSPSATPETKSPEPEPSPSPSPTDSDATAGDGGGSSGQQQSTPDAAQESPAAGS